MTAFKSSGLIKHSHSSIATANSAIKHQTKRIIQAELPKYWCKTVMEIEVNGSWPITKTHQEGWSEAAKRSWEDSASCKSCSASYYGYTATATINAPLPSPTIASPQPTSNFAWQIN